jgi:hypothetical protein
MSAGEWDETDPNPMLDGATEGEKAMAEPKITTYIEYLYPGTFYSESSARVSPGRDPDRAAREAPESAFAFRFYGRAAAEITVDGQPVTLKSGEIRATGRYYIDAEALDAAAVAALPGDYSILLSNMRGNGWGVILRCRTGNFQPLQDGDEIVKLGGGHDTSTDGGN